MLITESNLVYSFFTRYPAISYKRGEKILRPNEYFNHIYLLEKGHIRVYKILKTGQEITINCYNQKKQKFVIFGYTPLLVDYYIEALTDALLYRAPKVDFDKFCQENPVVKSHIIKDFEIGFEEFLHQIEWLAVTDAYTRIKMVLYSLAKRLGVTTKEGVMLDNTARFGVKITHSLIASLSGLSRETVTVQINRLIDEGYLNRKNNTLFIPHPEKLMEAVR